MKFLFQLLAVIGLIQPAFALNAVASDSATSLDLNGRWEVSPADSGSISSFVIGELELVQTGNEVKGSYTLKHTGKRSSCSSSSYDVSGTVDGNKVRLTAVGSKSKLNGSATGNSRTLQGSGMEFFSGGICSGYVKSSFVMNKI